MVRHIGLQFWTPLRAIASIQQSPTKAVNAQMVSLSEKEFHFHALIIGVSG